MARFFLVNVDDFATQITSVVLFAFVKLVIRALESFVQFVLHYIRTCDWDGALWAAEKHRISVVTAHEIYFDQVLEFFGIFFALTFFYISRLYYSLDYPSITLGVTSVVLQVVGEIAASLLAIKIEESYFYFKQFFFILFYFILILIFFFF